MSVHTSYHVFGKFGYKSSRWMPLDVEEAKIKIGGHDASIMVVRGNQLLELEPEHAAPMLRTGDGIEFVRCPTEKKDQEMACERRHRKKKLKSTDRLEAALVELNSHISLMTKLMIQTCMKNSPSNGTNIVEISENQQPQLPELGSKHLVDVNVQTSPVKAQKSQETSPNSTRETTPISSDGKERVLEMDRETLSVIGKFCRKNLNFVEYKGLRSVSPDTFVKDDDYCRLVLHKLNPLVMVKRSKQINKILKILEAKRENLCQNLPLSRFAAMLGLVGTEKKHFMSEILEGRRKRSMQSKVYCELSDEYLTESSVSTHVQNKENEAPARKRKNTPKKSKKRKRSESLDSDTDMSEYHRSESTKNKNLQRSLRKLSSEEPVVSDVNNVSSDESVGKISREVQKKSSPKRQTRLSQKIRKVHSPIRSITESSKEKKILTNKYSKGSAPNMQKKRKYSDVDSSDSDFEIQNRKKYVTKSSDDDADVDSKTKKNKDTSRKANYKGILKSAVKNSDSKNSERALVTPNKRQKENVYAESSDESKSNHSNSSPDTSFKQNKLRNSSGYCHVKNRTYTMQEDRIILDHLMKGENNKLVKGTLMWKALQKQFFKLSDQARTWQSLKNRYLKYILPNLQSYGLSNHSESLLRSGAYLGEIKKKTPRDNSIFKVQPVISASNIFRLKKPNSVKNNDNPELLPSQSKPKSDKPPETERRQTRLLHSSTPKPSPHESPKTPSPRKPVSRASPRKPTPTYSEVTRKFFSRTRFGADSDNSNMSSSMESKSPVKKGTRKLYSTRNKI